MKSCALCGAEISDRRKYCVACLPAAARLARKKYKRKRATESIKPAPLRSRHRKLRVCLRCDREFDSEGPWNRLCPKCRHRPEFQQGSVGRGFDQGGAEPLAYDECTE